MNKLSQIEVTQADREAAASVGRETVVLSGQECLAMRVGDMDSHWLPLAFARHRQQAIRSNASSSESVTQHEGDSRAKHLADTRARMIPGDRNTVAHEGGRGEPEMRLFTHDERPLYAHPPATSAAGLVEGEVEALATFMNPELFCGDPDREHRAASPRKVDYEKEAARKTARDILSHLFPRITQQAEEQASLKDEVARLRRIVARFVDMHKDDPCWKDHHGYCQAHFLEEQCLVADARAALNEQPGGEE